MQGLIDSAFVGRCGGSVQLAALAPGTSWLDSLSYLCPGRVTLLLMPNWEKKLQTFEHASWIQLVNGMFDVFLLDRLDLGMSINDIYQNLEDLHTVPIILKFI